VVLPVRDGGRWLGDAVASILAQSLQDLELLVVDDHSGDQAIARLPRGDPRLRVLRNPGRGVSSAFNHGMAHAGGRFIARMDADDVALPRRLETQLDYLQAHPELGLCGGCVEIFEADGGAPAGGNRRYQGWLNSLRSPAAIRRELFVESPIPNPTAVFRRGALLALGGYGDPDWPEDYDLFLRADAAGMRMGKPGPTVLRWREHGGRLTRLSPRYAMQRFHAAKAHYLARHRLLGKPPVVLWGAGPTGRLFHDLLVAEGVGVKGFLDVHPRRVGGSKRGLPVWPIAHAADCGGHPLLVAVGAAGARRKIRRYLQELGRSEGEQYLFVA